MMRTWKLLAVTAVLTVPSAMATAGGTVEPAKETVEERLSKMDKRVADAFKKTSDDMMALKAEALMAKTRLQAAEEKIELLEEDLALTRKDVVKLRIELNDLKKRSPRTSQALYPPSDKASTDAIINRLGKIEDDLSRLNRPSRVSLSPAPTGRLKLINDRAEEVLFIVNGHIYRIAPNMIQMLEQVPAGAFTYEVISPSIGLRGRNTTVLAAGETCTLTAH